VGLWWEGVESPQGAKEERECATAVALWWEGVESPGGAKEERERATAVALFRPLRGFDRFLPADKKLAPWGSRAFAPLVTLEESDDDSFTRHCDSRKTERFRNRLTSWEARGGNEWLAGATGRTQPSSNPVTMTVRRVRRQFPFAS